MVAITAPQPAHFPAPRRRPLRLVPGPLADTSDEGAPRRFAAVVMAALAAAVVVAAIGYLAMTTPTPPGATGTPATLDAHVVAEGETMWSIAQEVAPAGEAATYVERLVDANGGATLRAGQVLTVPVP